MTAFALAGEIADRIAATVNEVAIPETAVRRAMVISALTPEPGESPESFRARVLDALIDQLLQYGEALRFGPPPPDAAAVQAAMERLQQKLRAQGKDPETEFTAAGLTVKEVRDTLERQIVVQRYLVERFRPVAIADQARAREQYEKNYGPERRAAGLPVPPFEQVVEEMRTGSQERIFEEEVAKWMRELRARSRVAVYRIPIPVPPGRTPVVISTGPAARRTPTARIPGPTLAPTPAPTPGP